MPTALLIIFLISHLAFALSTICGGRVGLILLPVSQVPAAFSIGTLTSSASHIAIFCKDICW